MGGGGFEGAIFSTTCFICQAKIFFQIWLNFGKMKQDISATISKINYQKYMKYNFLMLLVYTFYFAIYAVREQYLARFCIIYCNSLFVVVLNCPAENTFPNNFPPAGKTTKMLYNQLKKVSASNSAEWWWFSSLYTGQFSIKKWKKWAGASLMNRGGWEKREVKSFVQKVKYDWDVFSIHFPPNAASSLIVVKSCIM